MAVKQPKYTITDDKLIGSSEAMGISNPLSHVVSAGHLAPIGKVTGLQERVYGHKMPRNQRKMRMSRLLARGHIYMNFGFGCRASRLRSFPAMARSQFLVSRRH